MQFVGKAIVTAIGIVILGLLTRYLGVTGYGEYTVVFAFLGFFAVVADFGLFTVVVRDIAKDPERKEQIFGNAFAVRIVLALGVLILAPLVGFLIPRYGFDIKAGIGIAAFASFFILLNQTLAAVFQAHLRMDRVVIVDTVGKALVLVLVAYCIRRHFGFLAIVAVNSVANLAAFALSLVLARPFFRVRVIFDWEYWRRLVPEILPLGVILMLGMVYLRIDHIILSLVWGPWQVGIYGVPYKILEILSSLPAIFVGSVLPIISKYLVDRDERLLGSIQRAFDFLILLAVPLMFGVFILAPGIIGLFAGAEFALSVPLLRILVFASGLIFLGTLAGNVIVAANLQRRLVKIYLISVIGNVGLNLIFIPIYSFYAAAVITVLTEAWACAAALVVVRKHLGWVPKAGSLGRAVLASLVMSAVVLVLGSTNLAVQVASGVVIYGVALFLMGGINRDMIDAAIGRTR